MNIVITGTSNGLGLELARWYLARDHRVVGLSRSASRVEHHRYRHFALDVGNRSQVVAAATDCGLDVVDVVINNAGLPGSGRRIAEVDPTEVQALLDVNLFGSLHVVQAFLPRLQAVGGRIVHVSSRFGSLSYNRRTENRSLRISYSYRIAKAAQNMLAVCLANELEGTGVTVEVLHPGSFQSACGRDDATDSAAEVAGRIGAWLSVPPTPEARSVARVTPGARRTPGRSRRPGRGPGREGLGRTRCSPRGTPEGPPSGERA